MDDGVDPCSFFNLRHTSIASRGVHIVIAFNAFRSSHNHLVYISSTGTNEGVEPCIFFHSVLNIALRYLNVLNISFGCYKSTHYNIYFVLLCFAYSYSVIIHSVLNDSKSIILYQSLTQFNLILMIKSIFLEYCRRNI